MVIIDAHCDSLSRVMATGRDLGVRSEEGHVDLPRLLEGGVAAQFFAAFPGRENRREAALVQTLKMIDLYHRLPESGFRLADSAAAIDGEGVAAFLAVEGADGLCGSLEVLRLFHRLGVRLMTLTWNHANEVADGIGEERGGGLTGFGREVVREMEQLGMLIDVSHLSVRGFWDVFEHSTRPFIASHSNAKALCGHRRNLDDDQIRAIAGRGGVIGVNFCPAFLVEEGEASIDDLLDHIDHIVHVGGMEAVCLGSDFDGIDSTPRGLEDASKMSSLEGSLAARGYSPDEVDLITGGNLTRVIREVIG